MSSGLDLGGTGAEKRCVEAWIQRHDFTVEAMAGPTLESCLEVLRSFDWKGELTRYEEALEQERERCPPALVVVDNDRTLQVMPMDDGRSHYSYTCVHPLRLMAFFGASKTCNAWAIGDEHRAGVLAHHFAGEQAKLVRSLCHLTATPPRQ